MSVDLEKIVSLWRDIASPDYWEDILNHRNFVSLEERYIQTGMRGSNYEAGGVIAIGQNPRRSNNDNTIAGDSELFGVTKEFSKLGTTAAFWNMCNFRKRFMEGSATGRAWAPYKRLIEPIGLNLSSIAYLNLIPLATYRDTLTPKRLCENAFARSILRQVEELRPSKIIFFGQKPYELFHEWYPDTNIRDEFISNIRSQSSYDRQLAYRRIREFLST